VIVLIATPIIFAAVIGLSIFAVEYADRIKHRS